MPAYATDKILSFYGFFAMNTVFSTGHYILTGTLFSHFSWAATVITLRSGLDPCETNRITRKQANKLHPCRRVIFFSMLLLAFD